MNQLLKATLFISVFGSLLLAMGCRKKEQTEVNEFYEDLSKALCFNGIMDTNELGTDCGGPCDACIQPSVSCETPPNTFDPEALSTRSILFTEIDSTDSWTFRAIMPDEEYAEFHFASRPDISLTYELDEFPSGSGKVRVNWFIPPSIYKQGQGNLVIHYEDGHYVIKACNILFPWGFGDYMSVDLNISF